MATKNSWKEMLFAQQSMNASKRRERGRGTELGKKNQKQVSWLMALQIIIYINDFLDTLLTLLSNFPTMKLQDQ